MDSLVVRVTRRAKGGGPSIDTFLLFWNRISLPLQRHWLVNQLFLEDILLYNSLVNQHLAFPTTMFLTYERHLHSFSIVESLVTFSCDSRNSLPHKGNRFWWGTYNIGRHRVGGLLVYIVSLRSRRATVGQTLDDSSYGNVLGDDRSHSVIVPVALLATVRGKCAFFASDTVSLGSHCPQSLLYWCGIHTLIISTQAG